MARKLGNGSIGRRRSKTLPTSVSNPARGRALAVLARMRRGESLSDATRAEHTTARTVRKLVGKQIRRGGSGRYFVTRSDRLRRDLTVLGFNDFEPVTV